MRILFMSKHLNIPKEKKADGLESVFIDQLARTLLLQIEKEIEMENKNEQTSKKAQVKLSP